MTTSYYFWLGRDAERDTFSFSKEVVEYMVRNVQLANSSRPIEADGFSTIYHYPKL